MLNCWGCFSGIVLVISVSFCYHKFAEVRLFWTLMSLKKQSRNTHTQKKHTQKNPLYRWETSTCTRMRNATPITSSSFPPMTWCGAGTSVWRNPTIPVDACPSSSLTPTTTGRSEGSPLSHWSLESDSPRASITRWVKTCEIAHKMEFAVWFEAAHEHFKRF